MFVCLKRGRWFGSAARSAFQRKMRAPCDSKNPRNTGVKNDDPSGRGLNSSNRRPSGLRNRVRISLIKKFPIGGCPFEPFSVVGPRDPVKADAVAGHEIEFLSEIGQRRLRFDAPNDAPNVEELGCPAKERLLIGVEPEPVVPEEPAEIQEVTRAAAKIQDIKGRGTIEPKILRAFNVYADPVCCVFVRVDLPRIRAVGIKFSQVF